MTIQSPSSPPEGQDLRRDVEEIARRLSEIEVNLPRQRKRPPGRGVSDQILAEVATSIYRARRRRDRFFPGGLFAEPAWDMLLDLFISKARGQRVSTSSLAVAADIPLTTGLRRIAQLEDHGLVRRYGAPDDARLKLLELTPEGYRVMRSYVSEAMDKGELAPPS